MKMCKQFSDDQSYIISELYPILEKKKRMIDFSAHRFKEGQEEQTF